MKRRYKFTNTTRKSVFHLVTHINGVAGGGACDYNDKWWECLAAQINKDLASLPVDFALNLTRRYLYDLV